MSFSAGGKQLVQKMAPPLPYLREHIPTTASAAGGRKAEGSVTVREFYEEWIRSKEGAVHPSCPNDYVRHMRRYILPTVGTLPLASLRPMDVQLLQSHIRTLKHHRTGKPLSEKTIRTVCE